MKMKRIAAAVLLVTMLIPALGASAAEDSPFSRTRTYGGDFRDVAEDAWYCAPVADAYEYSLVNGYGDGSFKPANNVTIAELLALSARLNAEYYGASDSIAAPQEGEPWYMPYEAYLRGKGILPEKLTDYAVAATRAQMAAVFAESLPDLWYDDRNAELVGKAYKVGLIGDVTSTTPYREQILWMYRQGLLVGMDDTGSFYPMQPVTRAETAALLTRIVEPALRITPEWKVPEYRSAAGATLASIINAPEQTSKSPDVGDRSAIDACVRKMLASGTNKIELQYSSISKSEASAIVQAFVDSAKTYCEQMYNQARISYTYSGKATLELGSTACSDNDLQRYRDETLNKAIAVHDALHAEGRITCDMPQYDIAREYFVWLCENCTYDKSASSSESISHLAYGALINGTAVCDGYTGAYNLLLKLEGIECRGLFNSEHIWTVAKLDGIEYHIDSTWGDQNGYVYMPYFAMSEEESWQKHPW